MRRFRLNVRRAAAGSQYALVVGLIGAIAVLAISSAGSSLKAVLERVAGQMGNVTGNNTTNASAPIGPLLAVSVKAWGLNNNGQLGVGDLTNRTSPTDMQTGEGLFAQSVLSASAGFSHACAVRSDGRLFCWGSNNNGMLGIGSVDTSVRNTPVAVANGGHYNGSNAVAVAVGQDHVLALLTGGRLVAWGSNNSNCLGDGTNTVQTAPVNVITNANYTGSNAARLPDGLGQFISAAMTADGRVLIWGSDGSGGLGDSVSQNSQSTPVFVTSGGGFTGSNAAQFTTMVSGGCILTTGGTAVCWGANDFGQVGNGTSGTTNVQVPVALTTGADYTGNNMVQISGGHRQACGIVSGGRALCWGRGDTAQLGNGGSTSFSTPQRVSNGGSYDGTNALAMRGGANNTCMIRSNGGVSCWGLATRNGDGSSVNRLVPVDVALTPLWLTSGPLAAEFFGGL